MVKTAFGILSAIFRVFLEAFGHKYKPAKIVTQACCALCSIVLEKSHSRAVRSYSVSRARRSYRGGSRWKVAGGKKDR